MATLISTTINGTLNVTGAATSYSYQGNGNVGGTGSAAWFPSGLYSGGTEWLYGTMYRNGASTYYSGGGMYDVGTLNGNANSATFYPNSGSYGSWRVGGTKNGWYGISFDNGNALMMNSDESGHHQEGYGWKWRWYAGYLRVSRSTYGGGSEYIVLDAGNYNSYSPTLTGGGASGTWSINITGSAGSASSATSATYLNSSNYIIQTGSTGSWNADFQNTPAGTLRHGGDVGANGTNGPGGSWWMQQNFRHTNSSNYWGIQVAWGWEDNANRLATRNVTGGSFGGWVYYLNNSNYTTYIDAPNRAGTSYYQANTWIQFNGNYGLYWPSNYGAHFYPNDGSSYTQFRLNGNKNGYGGIWDSYSAVAGIMYDSSGNGGVYREANGLWYFYYHVGNNCMGVGTSATSASYKMYVNGGVYATGDVVAYSDSRKKTDVITIDNALEKVTNLRGVFYTKVGEEDKGRKTGVIAQEINEVLPEVVTYAADVDEYGVAYGNITGVLIEAIKEQNEIIKTLKSEIDQLKAKLE